MSASGALASDRLVIATLIASALHVVVIFGVSFNAVFDSAPPHQVEVTLVQTPSMRPELAEHIAETDQRGSGSEAQRDLSSGEQGALILRETGEAIMASQRSGGRERFATPSVTTVEASQRNVDSRSEQSGFEDLPEADRELARLNQELPRLQADPDALRQQQTRNPRVRRLEAVAARSAVDAAYLARWRQRVEAVGNQYYPEASLRYGIYGSLRMLVTVRSDGALEDIRILSPSGHAVLDEAAMRIVRKAAPFPPFPEELRATTDRLEIVRTWQFEQNPLSSG